MGLKAAGGFFGFLAGKKKKPGAAPLGAPPPTQGPGAPEPPVVNPGADQDAALAAGQNQRKKAARGALGSKPMPKPGAMPSKAVPKTLIGGY